MHECLWACLALYFVQLYSINMYKFGKSHRIRFRTKIFKESFLKHVIDKMLPE